MLLKLQLIVVCFVLFSLNLFACLLICLFVCLFVLGVCLAFL